jgi:probable F420-dependent oxidoreductase
MIRFGFSLQGRGALAVRETIKAVATRADALDYDSIWVTDRLLIPIKSASVYPYAESGTLPIGPDEPWLEPLTALTYLATVTRRIKVGTSVLVVPYRHPVITAKALATLDYLSGGRVIFGAGAGWFKEEFGIAGAPFAQRGAMTIEYLRVMKAIWTGSRVAFAGRFISIPESGGVRPHPVQRPHIPIWIGGHSDAALRRVVDIGDGWHPLGLRPPVRLDPAEMADRVAQLRDLAAGAGRNPKEITVSFKAPLRLDDRAGAGSPALTGPPAKIAEDVAAYVAAGVEHFVFDFPSQELPDMLAVLERFAADVRPRVRRGA